MTTATVGDDLGAVSLPAVGTRVIGAAIEPVVFIVAAAVIGIADAMAHLGAMNALRRSDMVVAISPEHTAILTQAGLNKADVHGRLCKMSGRTLGELKRGGGYHEEVDHGYAGAEGHQATETHAA